MTRAEEVLQSIYYLLDDYFHPITDEADVQGYDENDYNIQYKEYEKQYGPIKKVEKVIDTTEVDELLNKILDVKNG